MSTKRAVSILAGWLMIMLAAGWFLLGITVSSDLTQFMPAGGTNEQRLAEQILREGPSSRTILIGLRGASTPELARLSKKLAQQLQDSGLFSQVNNGNIPPAGSAMETIFRYRYLLDPSISRETFSASALQDELSKRLAELSGPLALLDRTKFAADPTASMRSILLSWNAAYPLRTHDGVWFTRDGQEALLISVMHSSGYDTEAQRAAITTINQAFHELHAQSGVALVISGSPVFAQVARDSIRTDIQILSAAGGIFIMLILLVVFRSPRLVLLSALPLMTALVIGSVATSLLFGGLHGITLAFGITLLGVAIDYPIHLFSHLSRSGSAAESIRKIWPTLRLGVITTCIGYLAFARRDFEGLAQLGVFATSGLISAALVTRWLLPSLISTAPSQNLWQERLPRILSLSRPVARIIVASAALGLAGLFLFSPPAWEDELSALSPISAASRVQDAHLRSALGAADVSHLIILRSTDFDQALEHGERVAQRLQDAVTEGHLSGFDYAARYLPSRKTQGLRQDSLPDEATASQNINTALQDLPFKPRTFDAFLHDLAISRQLSHLTMDDIRDTPIESRIAPLLFHSNGHWNAVINLSGISDAESFRTWWDAQSISIAHYLDLKEISSSMLTDFRNSALEYVLLGIAAIWLTLALGLRSPHKASMILLPILMATALSAALLGIVGERLSLFHLIALLLITGIGIDYSLFFQRVKIADSGHYEDMHAVLVCAVSTMPVFGILALSPTPVLRAIGLTVAIGIPLSFLLALAFSRVNAFAEGSRDQL